MHKTRVILFTGKAQSGKSSSVKYLLDKYPDLCKSYSFADSLKKFCVEIFGIERRKIYGTNDQKDELTHIKWSNLPLTKQTIDDLKIDLDAKYKHVKCKEDYMTGREVMQIFGSEICRKMYPDCWSQSVLRKIASERPLFALIEDARFPNELLTFQLKNILANYRDTIDCNTIVIRLTRDIIQSKHISEKALDHFDFFEHFGEHAYTLKNESLTLDRKNERIDNIFQQYLKDLNIDGQ